MSDVVIRVENLSKQYRLGTIGSSTLRDDLARSWARVRGKPNPLSKVGHSSNGSNPSSVISNPSSEVIWALRDVSFEVKRGEVVGIIGRNGAGKSTLLKILSRITAPTSGQVKIKGRIASLLEVGTGFHPDLTGRENVYLNGAILGMDRAEIAKKFDEIVAFAEVEQFIDTPVKRYSSGMYMRLAFAVAAHLEPEILIIDEVLAVGDAAFQKKCLGKIGDVAKEGRTVLFVSHNLQTVRALCQYGVLLNQGRVEKYGDIHSIAASYLKSQSSFAADTYFHSNLARKPTFLDAIRVTPVGKGRTNTIEVGDDITVGFKIVCQQAIKNLSVGFSIHAEDGEVVSISYSGPRTVFDLTKGVHLLGAQLRNFSVTPGLYTIRARLEANGIEVDWPQGDLCEFEVMLQEILQGPRAESLANGQLFLHPEWQDSIIAELP